MPPSRPLDVPLHADHLLGLRSTPTKIYRDIRGGGKLSSRWCCESQVSESTCPGDTINEDSRSGQPRLYVP